jgi:hypothetical protein
MKLVTVSLGRGWLSQSFSMFSEMKRSKSKVGVRVINYINPMILCKSKANYCAYEMEAGPEGLEPTIFCLEGLHAGVEFGNLLDAVSLLGHGPPLR